VIEFASVAPSHALNESCAMRIVKQRMKLLMDGLRAGIFQIDAESVVHMKSSRFDAHGVGEIPINPPMPCATLSAKLPDSGGFR
jgi:hypothetical protein